jgi:hypothetical protein
VSRTLTAGLTEPWEAYRLSFVGALQERGDIKDESGLQIATDFQPALWDNATYGEWLAWESVANVIPAWGATYIRSAGNRVTDALQQFLTNLDVSGTQERSPLRATSDTRGTLITAMEDERRLRSGLSAAKVLQTPAPSKSSQARTLAAMRDRIWSLSQQLVREAETSGGDELVVAKALLAFNNPAYQKELTDDHGARLPYRSWTVRPSLSAFLADARAGRRDPFGFTADLQGPPGFGAGVVLRDSPILGNFLRLGRLSGAEAGSGAEATVRPETALPDEYRITLEARSFAAIVLVPGPWYAQDVVCRFGSGPFLPKGPFGAGKAAFWREGGVFPYTPTKIFVAFQPSIRATLPPDDFRGVRTAWSNGEAIGLGPLEFTRGNSGRSDPDEASFDDASKTFAIQSRSPHGIILAVNNLVMPCG